jgi:hypothetical protein
VHVDPWPRGAENPAMDVTSERTEEVRFRPLRFQRKQAPELIQTEAERHKLRIESVKERRRRASVELHLTVTGAADDIHSFCRATGGTAKHDPRSRLRRLIDAASNVRFEEGPYG